jgi:hypothetical protein
MASLDVGTKGLTEISRLKIEGILLSGSSPIPDETQKFIKESLVAAKLAEQPNMAREIGEQFARWFQNITGTEISCDGEVADNSQKDEVYLIDRFVQNST